MRNFYQAVFAGMTAVALAGSVWSDEPSLRLDFSGATLETNQVTVQGAGFGAYPLADVSFGAIPIDNTFEGATDGTGLIITADPGEGVMIFAPKITTTESALVRVSVRTDSSHAAVTLAAIGEEPDKFISYNAPGNEAYFQGQYLRLQTFCVPPSGGFQPLIQVHNTSPTEPLTACIDNFEVFRLDTGRYYSAAFLDGDEVDPPADKISLPSDEGSGVVPDAITISLKNGVTLDMVLIKPGSFQMGSPESEKDRNKNGDEGPRHSVTLTKSFYMGKYEVTRGQWNTIMGIDDSRAIQNLPMDYVTWNESQTFIQKLNALNKGIFRLPTEAEWEYACRAGTSTRFYWGDDFDYSKIGTYAWTLANSSYYLQDVGKKLPNAWGLYDMSGSVEEWCLDRYGSYSSSSQTNPQGPASGEYRVIRGGSVGKNNWVSRSACRNYYSPGYSYRELGFRVVRIQ